MTVVSRRKVVFITGATSGIGRATAQILAKEGHRLIICGRRKERLESLKNELSGPAEDNILSLSFDVSNRQAVFEAIQSLPEQWKAVNILINNAGNAHGLSSIEDGDVDDWEAMLDINVKGLLYVSKALIPQMIERKEGHIINIGSLAGKEVYPQGNVYCASKFAVDAISQSMRIDLNNYNIKVSAINPGLVETEFAKVRFKGDEYKAATVYEGFTPLSAGDVAEIIAFVVSRPAHVNIADLLLLPTAQASSKIVNKSQK
jgi:3-hydroxy acid dehydrogenase / malonic semialdehyde reductase